MITHALASTTLTERSHVPQVFQVTSHIVGFHSVLRVVIQLLSLYPFTQFLTCRDSHCENGSFEVLSLQNPSCGAQRLSTSSSSSIPSSTIHNKRGSRCIKTVSVCWSFVIPEAWKNRPLRYCTRTLLQSEPSGREARRS